jgi:transcriptional regulator with XRE-family HTH domain
MADASLARPPATEIARSSASGSMGGMRKRVLQLRQGNDAASLSFSERKSAFTLRPMRQYDHRLVSRLLKTRIPQRRGAPKKGDNSPTVAGLARVCGVKHPAASQWLSGKTVPEMHRIVTIAEYLRIPYPLLRHALEVDLGVESDAVLAFAAAEARNGTGESASDMNPVERLCALVGDLLEAQAADAQARRDFREELMLFMEEMRALRRRDRDIDRGGDGDAGPDSPAHRQNPSLDRSRSP